MSYRIFSVMCAVVLLTGCTKLSSSKTREDVLATAAAPFAFTGTAAIEGISQPIGLKVNKTATALAIELLSPEAVKGLTVEFGGESIKTSFHGLVMNLSPLDIPSQSLFIALRDVLSAVPGETAVFSEKGGLLAVGDRVGMLRYELVWSVDDLALKAINLPSMGGAIQVDDFIKMT